MHSCFAEDFCFLSRQTLRVLLHRLACTNGISRVQLRAISAMVSVDDSSLQADWQLLSIGSGLASFYFHQMNRLSSRKHHKQCLEYCLSRAITIVIMKSLICNTTARSRLQSLKLGCPNGRVGCTGIACISPWKVHTLCMARGTHTRTHHNRSSTPNHHRCASHRGSWLASQPAGVW